MDVCLVCGGDATARARVAGYLGPAFSRVHQVDAADDAAALTREVGPDVVVVVAGAEPDADDPAPVCRALVAAVAAVDGSLPVLVVGPSGSRHAPEHRLADLLLAAGARGFLGAGELGGDESFSARGRPIGADLSRRELDVLHGMTEGRSNSEIAVDLDLAEDTVKTHARRLFRKLGAGDRADAVARAFRQGILR